MVSSASLHPIAKFHSDARLSQHLTMHARGHSFALLGAPPPDPPRGEVWQLSGNRVDKRSKRATFRERLHA